jgi:hypothetical protein
MMCEPRLSRRWPFVGARLTVLIVKAEDVDRFLGLPKGSFDHIPNYARQAALEAIANVRRLEEQQLFRPGVYYIVLTDLTASTEASKVLGLELNKKRVETFVTANVEALGQIELTSYAQFLKEIGDATLFIFSSFADVYAWWQQACFLLGSYDDEWRAEICDAKLFSAFSLRAKTVIHLGEVSYITGGNPLCLAINQVFKIEKLFYPANSAAPT